MSQQALIDQAQAGLNSRFSDMRKAFEYVDQDRSGTVDRGEIERALQMWNIPMDSDQLDDLMAVCDVNGDGEIGYEELVSALARDTVQGAELAASHGGVAVLTQAEKESKQMHAKAQDVISSKFTDMRKAFESIDLDRSGSVKT